MSMTDPTPRERLLATLEGRTADRPPVSPFVQDEYLSWFYPGKETVDRVTDARALADELDFDLIAKPKTFEKPHFLRHSRKNWQISRRTEKEGPNLVDILEIATPDGILREETVGPDSGAASAGIHKAVRRHLLAEEEDREVFLRHLPEFPEEAAQEIRGTAAAWRRALGERGVAAPWGPGGIFNLASELVGIEELLMAPYEDGEEYASLMEALVEAVLPEARCLASSEVECVGIQANMANAAVMAPEFFLAHVRPYEQRLIDAIHGSGAFTVYHNCGYARRFYPIYKEMGMTVWETVSPPPQGDNDLAEAKGAVGGALCLLGNLDQIDFLKKASPGEVAAATRQLVEIGRHGGRYIFSTSDFLERDTPLENVRAMIDAARAG